LLKKSDFIILSHGHCLQTANSSGFGYLQSEILQHDTNLRQQKVKGSDLSFAHAQSKHVTILLVVIVCEVLTASLSIIIW